MMTGRGVLLAVSLLFVAAASAGAQDLEPACVKALDPPALTRMLGVASLTPAPVVFKDPQDQWHCAVMGSGLTMVTTYLRADPGGKGELRVRRTLHKADKVEPLTGLGEQAFIFTLAGDKPGTSRHGIVVHAKGQTFVLDPVPGSDAAAARTFLTARARAALGL